MVKCTFRIIFFEGAGQYVGVGWNYDEAVLVSTRAQPSYAAARKALDAALAQVSAECRWFDGAYRVPAGQHGECCMVPMESEILTEATIRAAEVSR